MQSYVKVEKQQKGRFEISVMFSRLKTFVFIKAITSHVRMTFHLR
jgi:hypothetical protein